MNYGMVARVIGNLLLLEAAVFSLPLGVSLYFKEREAVLGFLLAMGVVGLVGLFLSNVKKESAQLRIREAVLIVTLGWTLTSFFGALPFVFSGSVPSLIDAFFEAVSGFTTTGSTIIGRVEELPGESVLAILYSLVRGYGDSCIDFGHTAHSRGGWPASFPNREPWTCTRQVHTACRRHKQDPLFNLSLLHCRTDCTAALVGTAMV